jgi:MFS family permease
MVYPTLLAAVGDVAHPSWRASAVGVYRLWRDLGYAVGAIVAGVVADVLGLSGALWVVAALTFVSGVVAAMRMTETLRPRHHAQPDRDGGAEGGERLGRHAGGDAEPAVPTGAR